MSSPRGRTPARAATRMETYEHRVAGALFPPADRAALENYSIFPQSGDPAETPPPDVQQHSYLPRRGGRRTDTAPPAGIRVPKALAKHDATMKSALLSLTP